MSLSRFRIGFLRVFPVVDLCLLIGLVVVIYAIIGVAGQWAGPYRPKVEIELGLGALVRYSILSLVRVTAAYFLSLAFTFSYGYLAAKSRIGEPILIPVLDILQSVPVLGFMPGLVLALVNLFPHSNMGLELAAVLMIFTGEGWNMVFSFYSSVKSVPQELRELTGIFRLKKWEVLRKVEIPYATNGLLWNSMLSMAGGWFFLMVIESFTLGDKDFRLPGIGSYMAVAYEQHDMRAIVAGIAAMFVLIILVDRCVWAPLVVWSERFKWERDSHAPVPRSIVLEWVKRSNLLALYYDIVEWVSERARANLEKRGIELERPSFFRRDFSRYFQVLRIIGILVTVVTLAWGVRSMYHLIAATKAATWGHQLVDTMLSLVRVTIATGVGSLWAVPAGVFIGMNPVWTRRLQPVVQVVASFPAPMLFPMIVFVLLKLGVSMNFGSVVLMIFASQWYILFNVIAGATLIPMHMQELAKSFRVTGWRYWRAVILPAIFPSLVNGWITAAGGAWNASIVAEYVTFGKQTLAARGIGADITLAANAADYPHLASGVLVMVTTVVLLNRFFWGALYRLAETRFRME